MNYFKLQLTPHSQLVEFNKEYDLFFEFKESKLAGSYLVKYSKANNWLWSGGIPEIQRQSKIHLYVIDLSYEPPFEQGI